jgi:hypothetical protein
MMYPAIPYVSSNPTHPFCLQALQKIYVTMLIVMRSAERFPAPVKNNPKHISYKFNPIETKKRPTVVVDQVISIANRLPLLSI